MNRWIGPALAAPVTLWLLLSFAAPMFVVLVLSLHEYPDPFGPLFLAPSIAQFRDIVSDGFYFGVVSETILLGLGVTVITALLGYPLAHWLARMPVKYRAAAFAVILIPLLTNVVVRSLGIILLLAPEGLVNSVTGLIGIPPARFMLFTHGAVAVALAQVFLPFMVLALYDNLQNTSPRVHEAAQSLGASPAVRFLTVDLPLSLPGLRSGTVIVFLMATTAYVSASLLGGKKVWTTGMLVLQEAIKNLNAPLAAALAIIMTVTGLAFAALCAYALNRLMPWLKGKPSNPWGIPRWLVPIIDILGPIVSKLLLATSLLLLLLPLVLVCVQSFNDVPQATASGFRGFTLKWYEAVFFAGTYADAFWVSVRLAVTSMLVALALSLPAAFALARYPFKGRSALLTFWLLPMSLPHVAIGVGMLRLLQIYLIIPPFLGLVAIHVIVILPFAITLLTTSVMGLDRAQEEAAASLGASPVRRFFLIIMPGMAPGLFAAGIVGFLLSFGEVTVTSFLTTARLTTLPVRIYAESTFSLEPTAHAISAVLILFTVIALTVLGKVVRLDRLYAR
ncbi:MULTISPECIES: ABC transporter permease subunit [unclassified Neorhizobium]|uniref:ABC transporter permease subunit n=1 Tax=unclassified Neorhizobium TaxID=2629175 RepID=UPI001FF3B56A|nr:MULTISPECIES: ABC transporter permease subunit [unclassified Neorhizobium]MCJ9668793.1 ABC transporter permease subunit [Neorhizobium sp. SHOUNA12B]MCJ9744599.1 ABC transporter permease subunit [Neorhizobium sp. SHOUNA12A]